MLRKGFARIALLDALKERQGSNQHAASSSLNSSAQHTPSLPASGSPKAESPCEQNLRSSIGVGNEEREERNAELRSLLDRVEEGAVEDVLNRDVEQAAVRASGATFERMIAPGTLLGVECGNMYTGQSHNFSESFV
jgi:hypothetical protein